MNELLDTIVMLAGMLLLVYVFGWRQECEQTQSRARGTPLPWWWWVRTLPYLAGVVGVMAAVAVWRWHYPWVPLPQTWDAYVAEQQRYQPYEAAIIVAGSVLFLGLNRVRPDGQRVAPSVRLVVVLAAIAGVAAWWAVAAIGQQLGRPATACPRALIQCQ